MDNTNKEKLELLEIKDGKIYLDSREIKNLEYFELKTISHNTAEVTLKKVVRID